MSLQTLFLCPYFDIFMSVIFFYFYFIIIIIIFLALISHLVLVQYLYFMYYMS